MMVVLFQMVLRSSGDGADHENITLDQSISENKINTVQEVLSMLSNICAHIYGLMTTSSPCLYGWSVYIQELVVSSRSGLCFILMLISHIYM